MHRRQSWLRDWMEILASSHPPEQFAWMERMPTSPSWGTASWRTNGGKGICWFANVIAEEIQGESFLARCSDLACACVRVHVCMCVCLCNSLFRLPMLSSVRFRRCPWLWRPLFFPRENRRKSFSSATSASARGLDSCICLDNDGIGLFQAGVWRVTANCVYFAGLKSFGKLHCLLHWEQCLLWWAIYHLFCIPTKVGSVIFRSWVASKASANIFHNNTNVNFTNERPKWSKWSLCIKYIRCQPVQLGQVLREVSKHSFSPQQKALKMHCLLNMIGCIESNVCSDGQFIIFILHSIESDADELILAFKLPSHQ